MSEITVSQYPVLQLDLPGYSVLPVALPLNTQGEGSGYIDNPIGGPLKLDLGPLAPIQYPNQGEEARGPQGPMGQTGPRGPRGLQGNGKSAYQIWLEAGNVGSVYDFLASLGYGVDLGSLIELIRGPLGAELGERLSEQDLKILQAQMAADARLYAAEVAIHEANTNTANAIAAEALARADAMIALHGELESAIIAESVTRSNEDESYASQTNLLFAQFDTDLRALVSQEASARATADQANAEQTNLVNSRLDSGGDIATAMSTLQTNITNTNGQVSILSQSIDQVQANLSSATSSLQASYDSLSGKYNASHTVTLNVDGHISGTRSENDGTRSSFSVLADVFRVIGSTNQGLEWLSGALRAYMGTAQVVIGGGIGNDNLLIAAGPNVGASGATKANSSLSLDSAGNLEIRGRMQASLIQSSALAIESLRIATGGGRYAPFTIRDGRYIVQNGTNASRTLTVDGYVSPGNGSGYHWKRFARHRMDVWLDVQISGDTGNETAIVEVQYDGGGWQTIESVIFNCNYRGSYPILIRYTTLESWGTVAFRVRTTQNRTEAMRITVDVANYNESGNSPGSSSGVSGGGGAPPPPGGNGGNQPPPYEIPLT